MHYAFPDLFITEDDGKSLKDWMRAIQVATLDDKPRHPLAGPFEVEVIFYFQRPQKPQHPERHITTPDYDKLARAIGDALEGTYWKNDSQISDCIIRKRYTEDVPGAQITIRHFGQQMQLL